MSQIPQVPPFQQPPPMYPVQPPPPGGGKAIASLVLGLVGLIAWCLPLIGFPVSIVGIVMGSRGMKSDKRGMATAGLVLSIICLAATLVNAGWGCYLGATGQHPLLNQLQNR